MTEEEESVCDWEPPPEVEIVESEVFLIPSGLPSLEEFVRTEIEKEQAAIAAAEAAAAAAKAKILEEAEGDEEGRLAEEDEEALADDGSMGEQPGEEAAGAALPEEVASLEDFDMPTVEVKKPKKVVKKTQDDWYDMDVKLDFDDIKKALEKQAREERQLRLIASTHEYIGGLIDKVVDVCEYEDPDEILRTRLCKPQILAELDDKLYSLDDEQRIQMFLNRKIVEYFRRKRAMRPLMEDSPETILNEMRKYRENLLELNKLSGLESVTTATIEAKLADLSLQLKEITAEATNLIRSLEAMMKRVFAEGNDKMEIVVDTMLTKMKNMRKEISNVRFILIQRQHTMRTIQEEAKKLEFIGDGLRMLDYEHLQTETQALGKKIEERNNELNRLHTRCNTEIHTLAHIREKQQMTRNTIAAQQETYDRLVQEKQDCRELLNSLKMERGALRREFQRISFQGGLLDKPELLIDFDATKKRAEMLRVKVAEMKVAQEIVNEKITRMMRAIN